MIKRISLGIDPGSSTGCVAWIMETNEGSIKVDAIRFSNSTEKEVSDKVKQLASYGGTTFCVVEKAGSMPGEGHMGALTFGENIGFIRGILIAHGIPFEYVSPQRWQKEFVTPVKGKISLNSKTKRENNWDLLNEIEKEALKKKIRQHNSGMKKEHKGNIKNVAERLFPSIRVLNDNADALVIAKYCQNHHGA